MGWGWDYRPYVPVAKRRANAPREVRRFAAKDKQVLPVELTGRVIASTFWGKAWCDNLESYSDFLNRLPRGRAYVRNGSVVDLQIEPGKITSMVSGSCLYRVTISIRPLAAPRWKQLKQECGAGIGSVVELLQGRLSTSVMALVTSRDNGLFPAPAEIEMLCSCPDWAGMCKHVAATLYGVGNRLDCQPELLFKLRQVDHLELIAQVGCPAPNLKGPGMKTIARDQLADVFGIELENAGEPRSAPVQLTQLKRDRKAVAAEETNDRAGSRRVRDEASPVPNKSSSSKRKTLTASGRKRIAEAQRRRWQAFRERMHSQNSNGNSPSPAPVKETGKAKQRPSANSKSAERVRDV